MDTLSQLKSVYTTLDAVTISGSGNIDKLCGCFYVLGQIIQELELQNQNKPEQVGDVNARE